MHVREKVGRFIYAGRAFIEKVSVSQKNGGDNIEIK